MELVCGDDEQVRLDCAQVAQLIDSPPSVAQLKILRELADLVAQADDSIVLAIFDLLASVIRSLDKPWPLLQTLLQAVEDSVLEAAVELALELVEAGTLKLDRRLLRAFSRLLDLEYGPFEDQDRLERFITAVEHSYGSGDISGDGLVALMRKDSDQNIRKMAARLLDRNTEPVKADVAAEILGRGAYKVLAPYLDYTRAGHLDLYALSGGRRVPKPVVDLFHQAGLAHGQALVREAIAALGWAQVSLGLQIEHLVEITLPNALPLMVRPDETRLFGETAATLGRQVHLVTAHGGAAVQQTRDRDKSDPVDRFRLLNITHAELLGDILDVAPLDKAKVARINAYMDDVVTAYAELFADVSDECAILPDVWRTLRKSVDDCLLHEPDVGPLSAELTRLVLAFEDPANLGEVRTVHGAKRYLHQKGLKLGFEMVGTSHAPNRTVDLMLMTDDGRQVCSQTIKYADFESGPEVSPDFWLPHPVRIVAEGLSRQLLYGIEAFPSVDVFIFGNEVHYYIAFRNHPAFLRVDYSPPQRGGMLDLEYYGVSNYELDAHPNLNLDAIRLLYRKLEFDVRIEGTRLFVRYDKERSNSLGDLCDHAAALFRLAPFLMDVDWVIGSLQVSKSAKAMVAEQWADRFVRSGVMPLNGMLNKKRTGILVGHAERPTGIEEILWDGQAPYTDGFSQTPPSGYLDQLCTAMEKLWLSAPTLTDEIRLGLLPLLELEQSVIGPVRQALQIGQVVCKDDCLQPGHPELFQIIHEAEYFATLLAEGGPRAAAAGVMARPVAELERFVEFTPTGFVGGLVVQRAQITVRGGDLSVFAARDAHGVIRLGAYTLDSRLTRSRARRTAAWRTNDKLDAQHLWTLLRGANYLADAPAAVDLDAARDLDDLRALAALRRPAQNRRPTDDERILTGLKAAPGRAVGQALFGTGGRQPADLDGAILVAREVRPTDNQYLFRASGVISTGGAVLSHAALLAIQFGKPAVVAEARWDDDGPVPALSFGVTVFREIERIVEGYSVCVRAVVRQRTDELVENDLVILDANEGSVQILGQARDTLGLWEGLRLLGQASERANHARDDADIMDVRAQQLRARHQIQKILDRLTDPILTAFAVEEIVVGETLSGVKNADKHRLLSRVLNNPRVADTARSKLLEICQQLADRCQASERAAAELIPTAGFLYEVLGLRLRTLHWREAMAGAVALLQQCGVGEDHPSCEDPEALCDLARIRLTDLRCELLDQLTGAGPRARHLMRRIGRIGNVLGSAVPRPDLIVDSQELLAAADSTTLSASRRELVLMPTSCGLESHPFIGWKAANLAEMDRLAGYDTVPPWFVVTNYAFGRMLKQPVGSTEYLSANIRTLDEAITHILKREDLDNKRKSAAISGLWTETPTPDDLRDTLVEAHARLVTADDRDPFVAVRSSSCDEDTETVMRAGEFETYLFVRGVDSLLEHLRLTWGGLWTERALYSREAAGNILARPAAGLIVQRMVKSRVSGVLQTVNVARGELRELLINVGLGLGEGIVSGQVAADLITVVKDFAPGEDPVHLNYLTNDKPQQIIFDDRRGWGTRLVETLYHQRLRPALEYTELCEIVAKAAALEAAYGYPLDIEFAIEGTRLWLLQARPIATFRAELRETLASYPLKGDQQVASNREC